MAVRSTPRDDAGSPPRRRRGSAQAEAGTAPRDSEQPRAAQTTAQLASEEADIAAELSFREAQTALDLSLAELQAPELDVEQMAGLYRRASRYADRCEQLLRQVEQDVMQWDPVRPMDPPQPYQP